MLKLTRMLIIMLNAILISLLCYFPVTNIYCTILFLIGFTAFTFYFSINSVKLKYAENGNYYSQIKPISEGIYYVGIVVLIVLFGIIVKAVLSAHNVFQVSKETAIAFFAVIVLLIIVKSIVMIIYNANVNHFLTDNFLALITNNNYVNDYIIAEQINAVQESSNYFKNQYEAFKKNELCTVKLNLLKKEIEREIRASDVAMKKVEFYKSGNTGEIDSTYIDVLKLEVRSYNSFLKNFKEEL